MIRATSLAIALFVFWYLLSGHDDAFLLASGALASIAIAWAGWAVGYADEEGHPIELIPHGLAYWPWLGKEIALSAINVSRIILSPKLPISPCLVSVTPGEKSVVGVVTYANSITLTPGTITVAVDRHDNRFLIHALTEENAAGLATGEMDARVAAFEGRQH